jgi:lysophospholipase L1-like esterase|tara:strand:- start:414 stop:1949 length:1536 start_codon:yes stop_codon:yes gene_type:complete
MSVQVSYKKQTLLGIIGLIILFLIIEVIANVWWFTQVNCEFEENEIFLQMDNDKRRQLCVDLYEIKTSGIEIFPNQESQSVTINSLGFRGDEFSTEKPNSVYRVFMLGGSTMFGHGATSDKTTIPGYVQNFFQNNYVGYNIEVINSGIQGADSFDELNLIKTKLLDYTPDMIIIYDGWNDLRANNSASAIYNNWNSMCELGRQNGIDVMIVLQPIAGFGNKSLTKQEIEISKSGTDYDNNPLINSYKKYDEYEKNLEKLNNCQMSVNLRNVFDDESSPIYWDQGHVSDKGNNLIAKALQEKIIQLLPDSLPKSVQINEINEKSNTQTEMQIRFLLSNYKTPLMFNSIFSFEKIVPNVVDEPKNMIFETQSKIYNEEKISIVIEVLRDKDNPQIKLLEIKTVNNNTNYNISNVTYFLKILENNKLILSDFFYVENDVLEIQIFSENSNSLNISGKRQYEHNAIISSHELPINISGPLLLDDISYEFNFELRTIYDSTNWVFSLDDFHTKVMI